MSAVPIWEGTPRGDDLPTAATAYAAERPWKGISSLVLEAAGVAICDDGMVEIPFRAVDGRLLRTRLVAPSGRRWWARDGEGVHLLGAETLSGADPATPVLICEGESDALAAREHLPEFLALASPGASAFRAEWRALLEEFSVVYAIGDGDDAGRRFAWRVRRAVPWARPVVCPESSDLRELLQAGRLGFVRALLAEADLLARLEAAILRAPDLATCVTWLGTGIPSGLGSALPATEISPPDLPAPFTTYLLECPRCSDERPFVWRLDAYLCDGCGGTL